jgi:rubredoxin
MAVIDLDATWCPTCGGKKNIANPAWGEYLATLTPEQIGSGTAAPGIDQRITCPECRGLGRKVSDGFWLLRELLTTADQAGLERLP